jgi:dTDP-4-dehydrorhamnose 3,5-epimerase
MDVRPLAIEGVWEFTPRQFGDSRGVFLESFKADVVAAAIGHSFTVKQVNTSVSAAGVLRGIHFADVPPGQAKYVACTHGAVLDVVVDIRVGSPTFGEWEAVVLDDVDRRAIYVSEGLGHAFMSLADGSAVSYLCSEPYAPAREREIHPLDPAIGIVWPEIGRDGVPLSTALSAKDEAAPTLAEAKATGLLPNYDEVLAFRRTLS